MAHSSAFIQGYWGECFALADKDGNERISLKELKSVLQKQNCNLKSSLVASHFQLVGKGHKELTKDQFFQLYESLSPFQIQRAIFDQYAKSWKGETFRLEEVDAYNLDEFLQSKKSKKVTREDITAVVKFWSEAFMTTKELDAFLRDEQKLDGMSAKEIIERNAHSAIRRDTLSFSGFINYMLSDYCCILRKRETVIYMDMAQPFNCYFVNSSHNTYLEGNQLNSNCSSQAYINALKIGARFLELDVYPGENGGEPIIKHSVFPTKPVSFREVCRTVADHGFVYSSYPIILSLEDHCESNTEAKLAMNRILVEEFHSMLYITEPLPDYKVVPMPSPEQLQGKVVIKNRRVRNESFINICSGISVKKLGSLSDAQPNFVISLTKDKFLNTCKLKNWKGSFFAEAENQLEDLNGETNDGLVSFEQTGGEFLVELTKTCQIKVYPGNIQVMSGHFDPRCVWRCGGQFACLNFQTMDRNLLVNWAMFNRNGGCGYLLKPPFLLNDSDVFFNPVTSVVSDKGNPTIRKIPDSTILRVRILNAMHLPKPNKSEKGEVIDPYVIVTVLDKFQKANCKSYTTRVVDDNGFNPVWNEEFTFDVECPSLSFVLFEVYDKDYDQDDFIGRYCAHIRSLQRGYVKVPLMDKDFEYHPYSVLFAQINITHPRLAMETAL